MAGLGQQWGAGREPRKLGISWAKVFGSWTALREGNSNNTEFYFLKSSSQTQAHMTTLLLSKAPEKGQPCLFVVVLRAAGHETEAFPVLPSLGDSCAASMWEARGLGAPQAAPSPSHRSRLPHSVTQAG